MGFSYMSGVSGAYDKVVLYGGIDDTGVSQNVTYLLSLASTPPTWTQTAYTIITGPHSSTRSTYDPNLNAPGKTDGTVVLFGGYNCNGLGQCPITDGSTWFFDGSSSWASCACTSGNPGQRASEGMTTDQAVVNGTVVTLFGGDSHGTGDSDPAVGPFQDTWILSGSTWGSASWVECTSSNWCNGAVPGGRASPGLEYYPVTKKDILFGGSGVDPNFRWGDTWRYDQTLQTIGVDRWSKCTGSATCDPPSTNCAQTLNVPPCKRFGHRMAYFTSGATKEIVLFGGVQTGPTPLLNDTWVYAGNPGGWSVWCLPNPGCPAGSVLNIRCCTGLTFDSKRSKIILFGGQFLPKPHAYFDLWTWTPTAGWACISPAGTCNSGTP
jgi:hypothetical protein